MRDAQKLIKPVHYFNNGLYYQVEASSKRKLLNSTGKLKNFIVLDVTKNKIYDKEQFLKEFFPEEYCNNDIIDFLDTLKYKVYRKIK